MSTTWFIGKQQDNLMDLSQRIQLRKAHLLQNIETTQGALEKKIGTPIGMVAFFSVGAVAGWLGNKKSLGSALRLIPLIATLVPLYESIKEDQPDYPLEEPSTPLNSNATAREGADG